MLNLLCLNGFSKDAAHDESTESRGESNAGSQHDHTEAETQRDDEHGLVAHQGFDPSEEQGNQVDTDHEPEDEEEHQLGDAHHHLSALEMPAGGEGGEHDHQHYRQDILDDQDTQDETGEALLTKTHVIESLENDGGRGHGQHAAQEDAVHLAPTEGEAGEEAYCHHEDDGGAGGDDGG